MADETKVASLPVASEGYKGEIFAAFARMEAVPSAQTLIDQLDNDLWNSSDEYGMEAGSPQHMLEVDTLDDAIKKIA